MNISNLLGAIQNFDQLGAASVFQKALGAAKVAAAAVENMDRVIEDGKATLTATDMDELRPIMERAVPRAIAAGHALDSKLGDAAKR